VVGRQDMPIEARIIDFEKEEIDEGSEGWVGGGKKGSSIKKTRSIFAEKKMRLLQSSPFERQPTTFRGKNNFKI